MALNPLDITPEMEAAISGIRQDTPSMFGALNPFKSKAEIDDPDKSIAVMSEAERVAKLAGHEIDDPNAKTNDPQNPAENAEVLYNAHLRTMAADMGIKVTPGMNTDDIGDAIQQAQNNGGVEQAAIGDNFMTTLVNGDIAANEVDLGALPSPLVNVAVEQSEEVFRNA